MTKKRKYSQRNEKDGSNSFENKLFKRHKFRFYETEWRFPHFSIVIISQEEYNRFICLRISETTISPWGRNKKERPLVPLMNTFVECSVSAREGDVTALFLPIDSLYVLP